MLKSKARRRVATKAAATGVISAAILLGAGPALGTESTVAYKCTRDTAFPSVVISPTFKLTLTGPVTNPTPNAPVSITWKAEYGAGLAEANKLTAPTAVAADGWLVAEADVEVSAAAGSTPITGSTPKITASATSGTLNASAIITPPAQVGTVVVTPTAVGTIGVKANKFVIKGGPKSGTTLPTTPWYTCEAIASAEAPSIAITVATGGATGSTTPTPTPTATTPRPTRTVFETVTATPKKTRQVTKTPGGGASTGGGGDIGPDGRVFVLTGTALILGAAVGGLMLRARRRAVRH